MRRIAILVLVTCALFLSTLDLGLCQERKIFRIEPVVGAIQPVGDLADFYQMGLVYGIKGEMEIAEYPCLALGIGLFFQEPGSKSENGETEFSIRQISGSLSYIIAPGSDFTPYLTFGAGNYREKVESPLTEAEPWIKVTTTNQRFGLNLGLGGNLFPDWAENVGVDLVGKYHVVYESHSTTKFFDFVGGLFYQF
ncbi:MAG: hypothetical protein AMJ73_07930 [candidate division Zixibacteria bacterium SM1_73]|nr:MAG: hypothetical protein AMJ73_07930 [candidate division Zixibacteria bacterium SM1_73]